MKGKYGCDELTGGKSQQENRNYNKIPNGDFRAKNYITWNEKFIEYAFRLEWIRQKKLDSITR